MFKTLARKFKLLIVFVLIVIMVTPHVVLTAQPHSIESSHFEHSNFDPTQIGGIEHFGTEEQFLQAPDPHCEIEQVMIDELQREQANLWMQEPSVRDALRFYELRNSSYSYSSLSQEDRYLILRQLEIADTAFAATNEQFLTMERDGLSLSKSIYVMVIVSDGLFSYIEAKQLIANIPNMIERNTEIMRFQQLIQNFDIPAEVRTRNLTDNSLTHAGIDQIQIATTSPGSITAQLAPPSERVDMDQIQSVSTTPGSIQVTLSPDRGSHSKDTIVAAFTGENGFNTARQMFLDGHSTAEIQTAFALGAALQMEPETFLLPPDTYRAKSTDVFTYAGGDSATRTNNAFEPTPAPPTPIRAVQSLPPAMEYQFNAQLLMQKTNTNADELDYLVEYGMTILGFGITPASAPTMLPHDCIISNPFNLHFSASESVNLNTGAAMYRTNVLSLPGRGGFGFSLDLVYNSADADVLTLGRTVERYRFCFILWVNVPVRGTWAMVWNAQFGWWSYEYVCFWCISETCFFLNPPTWENIFIEYRNATERRLVPNGLGAGWRFDLPHVRDNVLHIPGRGSFVLYDNQLDPVFNTLQNVQINNDTTFASGSHHSARRVTFLDGTSYFFTNDWRVIGQRDRFGNTIRFEYIWHTDQFVQPFARQYVLSRIIDSNGKQINFTHRNSSSLNTIEITGPNNYSYVIYMHRNTGQRGLYLARIRNQVGAVTSFTYDTSQFFFDFGGNNPPVQNHTVLLRRVTYHGGAQLRFNYGWHYTGLGQWGSSRNTAIVTSRYQYSNGRAYNHTTFSYQNSPTPAWMYVPRPPTDHTHTYSTTVTQNNGLRTRYTFNYRHLNTMQRTYNVSNALLSQQTIEYNNDRLPAVITLTEHGGGFTRTNTQRLYYNRYGQVTTAVSPMAQGSTHARYRTTTIHDPRFGLPLSTTFMPNTTTTVRTTNRLSADGRSIVETDIYENNIRMSRTNFIHDSFGNVTEVHEFPNANVASSIQTQFTFDRGTMPTSIRTTNVRDINGNLLAGTGIVERRFTYDAMWRVLSETDPNGYVTRLEYDRIGRVTQITHLNGGFETYTYNDQQNILTHRTILGAIYTHQFDGLGNLLTITDPNGIVILRNIYDNRMRVTETQNAQGIASSQRTVFFYDIFDRVIDMRRVHPTVNMIMYQETFQFHDVYDAAGNRRVINTIVNANAAAPSIQSFTQYDRFGRRTQEGIVGGRIFTYEHDLAGRVTRERSLGVDNIFTHNIFGITSARNIEGNTSRSTYDSMGRLLTATDFMGNTQRFTYDALGRLIRQDVPFEQAGTAIRYSTTLYFYDRNGNLTQSHSAINLPGAAAAWSITTNTFRHNRLMSSQTGNGPLTQFTYDLAGNILTQRVGGATNAATTTFAYNNRGQLIRTTDAIGQAETFTYDANGLPLTRTDRNGTLFRKTYNALGWLIREETVQNGVVVGFRRYGFYSTGAIWQRCNGTHTITYSYDAQGRLIRQEETGGIVKTFVYNAANNITEERIYVNGSRHYHSTYAFDVAQRVRTVSSSGQLLATYAYNANGSRIRTTLSNGIVTEYTRNFADLVATMVNRHGNTVLSRFDYIYHLDGNTQRVAETMRGATRTITYTYDTARRLTREQETGYRAITRVYTFDNRGNRTRMTVTGEETYTVNYTYDLNNRLLREARTGSNPSTRTFTYDRNGNQLTSAAGVQTETRTYNALNQLTRVTAPGMISEYIYRADGLRHSKTVNGVRTQHAWSCGNIVLERNATGTVTDRFERGAGGRLIRSLNHGWYLHDGRGSVVQRVGAQGNVLHTYRYSAFGVEIVSLPRVVFHFDGQTVTVPITNGRIDTSRIPVPATRYGEEGIPGQAFMGWFTNIFAGMHNVDSPNRATAFDFTQPITDAMLDQNGALNLYGSWLQYGDITGRGMHTMDVILLWEYLRGLPHARINHKAADVNVDGVIDAEDTMMIFLHHERTPGIILGVPRPGHGGHGTRDADAGYVDMDAMLHMDLLAEIHALLREHGYGSAANEITCLSELRSVPVQSDNELVTIGEAVQVEEMYGSEIIGETMQVLQAAQGGGGSDNPFRFNGMYWDAHTQTYYTPNRHLNVRTGRWLSPDPFWNNSNRQDNTAAMLQAGNLYMYVMHNPIFWIDATGLFGVPNWLRDIGTGIADFGRGTWSGINDLAEATWHEIRNPRETLGNFWQSVQNVYWMGPHGVAMEIFWLPNTLYVGVRDAWQSDGAYGLGQVIGPGLVLYICSKGFAKFKPVGRVVTTATPRPPATINFDPRKLQHTFGRHSGDFGFTGQNWNAANRVAFEQALRSHTSGQIPILGTYRGTQSVWHFFNPSTHVNVMIDMSGYLVGGWKLSPEQIFNLIQHGNIQ